MVVSLDPGWAVTDLTYFQALDYPGVDPRQIAAEYDEAARRIAEVCGLTLTRVADPAVAHIVASSGAIDGPWNVLALSQLPHAQAAADHRVAQTFDLAEALDPQQRIAVFMHEICHCLGLGHTVPGSGQLMEPALNPVAMPQSGDIEELIRRYGPAGPIGPPVASAPTGDQSAPVPVMPPVPAPAPDPPPAPPPARPGPPATSLVLEIPAAGSYPYTLGFDHRGKYLVLIIPIDGDGGG